MVTADEKFDKEMAEHDIKGVLIRSLPPSATMSEFKNLISHWMADLAQVWVKHDALENPTKSVDSVTMNVKTS